MNTEFSKKEIRAMLHAFGLNFSQNYFRIIRVLLSNPGWVKFQTLKAESGLANRTTLCRSLTSLEDHNIIERRWVSFYDYDKGAPNTIKEIRITEAFLTFLEEAYGAA